MDDRSTPLNKDPVINGKDVDLYRLFRLVQKLGGYNRVSNKNKWRSIAARLKFGTSQTTFNQVKAVYKKCLFSYETLYRTLGCTMIDQTRTSKKTKGRSLIRDKDRVTPVQSPRLEKDYPELMDKKEDENKRKGSTELKKGTDDEYKKGEMGDGEIIAQSDLAGTSKETGRLKRADNSTLKLFKDKKKPTIIVEKLKSVEEPIKKDEDEDKVRSFLNLYSMQF